MTALNHAIDQANQAYLMAKKNCPKSALIYVGRAEVELAEARKVLRWELVVVKG